MTMVPRQQSALFGSRGYRNHNAALSHSQIMETLFRTSYWAMYGIIYLPCPRQRIKMMKEPRDAVRIRRVSRRKWCTSLMRTLIDPTLLVCPSFTSMPSTLAGGARRCRGSLLVAVLKSRGLRNPLPSASTGSEV